jgi:hypothetical protein
MRVFRTKRFAVCAPAAAACLALCACDGSAGRYTSSLVSSPSLAVVARFTPANAPLVPLTRASCPAVAPFTTSVNLVLGPASSNVVFNRLALRFADGSTIASPLFFTPDELVVLFGDTRILAGTQRIFVLRPEFGCGLARPRSVAATIDLVDGAGNVQQVTANATLE